MSHIMDDLYITISSNNTPKYAATNTPHHFEVCLDQPLLLDSNMECALVDFTCSTAKEGSKFKQVYIYFNLVVEQPVGGTRESLLRHTIVSGNKLQIETFNPAYYMPVKQLRTDVLEVHIKDENGQDASFLNKTTSCTFHFRRKSWLSH